jgi:asparagine synthase (glutamine-hydrolysing)
MCGICAIYNFDRQKAVRPEVLEAMNGQIVHRGPDDAGSYIDRHVGIAMRRLSIVDLKSGHQPLSSEDGTVWIVFNGEIYNHAELRPGLEERGHRYRTRSDTETIIHLYEEYGEDCVKHLRGMFGFAIWDSRRRRFFCARDRLGIKPIYFARRGGQLLIASEIKSLLAYPGMPAKLEPNALPEYLAFGHLAGVRTLFAGVESLLPGHWLMVDERGKVKVRRYWDLPSGESRGEERSVGEYARKYRELLEQAVESHLMSDVPLGVLLSGGLDSSVVAAILQKRRGGSIQTFSVGYPEVESSELPMAARVAQTLGTEHHEVKIGAEDFFRALPRLIWHEDQPLVWPSSVSLYFVCQLARQRVKVVLTGEGSDETLAGYDRYAWTLWNQRFDKIYRSLVPGFGRAWMAKQITEGSWLGAGFQRRLGHTFLARDGQALQSFYLDNFYSAFSAREQQSLLAKGVGGNPYQGPHDMWKESSGDFLNRLLHLDIRTYLVELLRKQDRMSMASSIESRVPFLDHGVVEYALSIPARYKIRGMNGKMTLKDAARDLLPGEVIDQRKRGFPTPWRTWLSTGRIGEVEQLLLAPRSQERGFFRLEALRRLFWEHRQRQFDHSNRLWRLLNLELWHRVYVDADPAYRRPADEPQLTMARVN